MAQQQEFQFDTLKPIKGYPELHWTGKRPYTSTQYYPAQLRETYGEEIDGWRNRIYWGDNLQVMSHLLKEFRGKVDLIYIDPPFDSKKDYKRKIKLRGSGKNKFRGKKQMSDYSAFEDKQYGDIWSNDGYLQFMYERLILMRELLNDTGCIYLHCDWHKSSYLRMILDEIFGFDNFLNEIIWQRTGAHNDADRFGIVHDSIFLYSKGTHKFNPIYIPLSDEHLATRFNLEEPETGRKFFAGPITAPGDGPARMFRGVKMAPPHGRHWSYSQEKIDELERNNMIYYSKTNVPYLKQYMDDYVTQGRRVQSLWTDILPSKTGSELRGYPTQKPEKLLERIISSVTDPNDIIFDCFMGSGTTQAVAMKLGRRFIGADINLGAIQTTTKRLIAVAEELSPQQQEIVSEDETTYYTGFNVYNVNNYEIFRNPVVARELIMQAYEIQKFPDGSVWDGELDGRMVKIMPVNRIATKADLEGLKANLPYSRYERLKADDPSVPVEKITLICMGHEADLKANFEQELSEYKLDIQIVDILHDKAQLEFKREPEAEIVREGDNLVIRQFFPLNLMQKLSLERDYVEDWRELVDSVMIDWNFDGVVLQPAVMDVPEKNETVKGIYPIPADAGTIKVKITDVLSESLEVEV